MFTESLVQILFKVAKKGNPNVHQKNVVYPHNGILLDLKQNWSAAMYYIMDEPWEHYAKWKKQDRKGHIFYDSIWKCPEQAEL